jgi:hypothetical protein
MKPESCTTDIHQGSFRLAFDLSINAVDFAPSKTLLNLVYWPANGADPSPLETCLSERQPALLLLIMDHSPAERRAGP